MSKRAEYMDGQIDFATYYGLLVERLGEQQLRALLPGGQRTPGEWRRLLDADEHLNNVSLHKWDAMHPLVVNLVRAAGGGTALADITGSSGWSLSDSVCVLKQTARQMAATR